MPKSERLNEPRAEKPRTILSHGFHGAAYQACWQGLKKNFDATKR